MQVNSEKTSACTKAVRSASSKMGKWSGMIGMAGRIAIPNVAKTTITVSSPKMLPNRRIARVTGRASSLMISSGKMRDESHHIGPAKCFR